MRADAYLDVGGWRAAAAGEDDDLWRRLGNAGWPVLSSTSSVVITSGRIEAVPSAGSPTGCGR